MSLHQLTSPSVTMLFPPGHKTETPMGGNSELRRVRFFVPVESEKSNNVGFERIRKMESFELGKEIEKDVFVLLRA